MDEQLAELARRSQDPADIEAPRLWAARAIALGWRDLPGPWQHIRKDIEEYALSPGALSNALEWLTILDPPATAEGLFWLLWEDLPGFRRSWALTDLTRRFPRRILDIALELDDPALRSAMTAALSALRADSAVVDSRLLPIVRSALEDRLPLSRVCREIIWWLVSRENRHLLVYIGSALAGSIAAGLEDPRAFVRSLAARLGHAAGSEVLPSGPRVLELVAQGTGAPLSGLLEAFADGLNTQDLERFGYTLDDTEVVAWVSAEPSRISEDEQLALLSDPQGDPWPLILCGSSPRIFEVLLERWSAADSGGRRRWLERIQEFRGFATAPCQRLLAKAFDACPCGELAQLILDTDSPARADLVFERLEALLNAHDRLRQPPTISEELAAWLFEHSERWEDQRSVVLEALLREHVIDPKEWLGVFFAGKRRIWDADGLISEVEARIRQARSYGEPRRWIKLLKWIDRWESAVPLRARAIHAELEAERHPAAPALREASRERGWAL